MSCLRPCLIRLSSSLALAALAFLAPMTSTRVARAADPAPAGTAPAQAQTAEQLANEAYELHAAGKYAEAIAAYFKAYELSQAGAILFNIATIYDRKMHERQLAADFYRRYLLAPDTEQGLVKKATERLAGLKKEVEEEALAKRTASATPEAAPAPAATPALAAPPTADQGANEGDSGAGIRVAGLVIGALGLAGVGTSMGLGAAAKSQNDQANTYCHGAACTDQRGVNAAQQAGTFATASTVTFVSGLVLLGGGVIMVIAAPRGGSHASKATGISFGPMLGSNEAGMMARGTF
jgi:hypothetical protein